MYSIELRQDRKKLVEDNAALLKKAAAEKRDLTADEAQEWDKRNADADALLKRIERYEQQEALDKELGQTEKRAVPPGSEGPKEDDKKTKEVQTRAYESYLRFGPQHMTSEERAALEPLRYRGGRDDYESRALTTQTPASGGYTIPEEMRKEVQAALLDFGGMRQAAFILTTSSGSPMPIPTSNDTTNTGALLAENTAASEQDIAFSEVQLDAYKYTSKLIKVPVELLQDSAINIAAFIQSRFVERLGRITNAQYTTGTGSSQPQGVVTASTAGKTAAAVAAVTYLELLDLKHSVGSAYRRGARWMFKDSTLLALKKLVDSDGRPLWSAGMTASEPDRIDGDPYTINDDMAAMAASAKTILYGNFQKYWIRDVADIRYVRLDERYADADQVGFVAFLRTDGVLVDAGTNPIKHLVQAAA